MLITTAGFITIEMKNKVQEIAATFGMIYVIRGKQTIVELIQKFNEDILTVERNRIKIYLKKNPSQPLFFHPNSAMFRIKRIIQGENDPFLDAAQLKEGMSLLDCTLGLGSDSIVAGFKVGDKGKVTGIEKNPYLALLVKEGLKSWETPAAEMKLAMERIKVVSEDHKVFLSSIQDNAFDVVYFDPMFDKTIEASSGIQGIKPLTIANDLTADSITEAKRVAKGRVVLKDHWRSPRFAQYGFHVIKRKSAKFHFGFFSTSMNEN